MYKRENDKLVNDSAFSQYDGDEDPKFISKFEFKIGKGSTTDKPYN